MPTTERIIQNHTRQNKKARDFLKKHPNAFVGNINFSSQYSHKFARLDNALPLKNFSYDYAVPHPDRTLSKLLLDYNAKLWTPDLIKDINNIFARIYKVKGIHFYWI